MQPHGEVRTLSGRVRRIVAPNPGPMTGPGTNTYIVGESDLVLVDPGPAVASHVDAILACVGDRLRYIGRMSCVLNTLTLPVYVCRAWCIFGVWVASEHNVDLKVGFSQDGPDTYCKHSVKDGFYLETSFAISDGASQPTTTLSM